MLGLDVRAYGVVMVIYAVIDALDNPVLGHLSDRTRTRFGRRRPWLLVGAPLLAAAMIAFFSAPSTLDGFGLVLWFAVFAILCEAFDSMLNANYGALLPELFPDERDRAVANGLRQGFQLVALVISLAVTPLLTTSVFGTEDSTEGFQTTAIIYGAIAVAVIVFMALSANENPRYSTAERPALLRSLRSVVRNPLFWKVGLIGACYAIAMALVLSGVQLYVALLARAAGRQRALPAGHRHRRLGDRPGGVDPGRRPPGRAVDLAARLRAARGQFRAAVLRGRPGDGGGGGAAGRRRLVGDARHQRPHRRAGARRRRHPQRHPSGGTVPVRVRVLRPAQRHRDRARAHLAGGVLRLQLRRRPRHRTPAWRSASTCACIHFVLTTIGRSRRGLFTVPLEEERAEAP